MAPDFCVTFPAPAAQAPGRPAPRLGDQGGAVEGRPADMPHCTNRETATRTRVLVAAPWSRSLENRLPPAVRPCSRILTAINALRGRHVLVCDDRMQEAELS